MSCGQTNKRDLSETDIRSKFITPAILKAGWDHSLQIREELYFTKGRIIVRGKLVSRGKAKKADYVLYYKPNIPIAIIEAKDIRAGLIKINPVKGIKLLNPNNVRDRILSSEETARLFAAAGSSDDFIRPLFHMLFHTGMRLGEALALEWADVEFEHRRIVIRQSKSGEGRKIPLRSALADELIRWKPHSRGSRWVFPARYDVAEPMQSIRKGWSRLCAKAAVSLLRPHESSP